MKFPPLGFKVQVSLRTRFALGIGAVLLPFLVAAAVGQYYLLPRLVEPVDEIVREFTETLEPVVHLRKSLLQAAMPVNDYLIHGDPDERRQFVQLRQQVKQAFEEASPAKFPLATRALIEASRAEWARALPLGEELLRLPNPVGNTAAAHDMERFDALIDSAVAALDEMHELFHKTLHRNVMQVGAARTRSQWVSAAAFLLATAMSLFAGVILARSVTEPVYMLRQGAARLAQGDLSHRVIIHRHDELGQLVAAFNAMAGHLEADRAALAERATRDGLTGLYNHLMFYVLLEEELARALRFGRPVSLLLLDIDYFKYINDTFGHLAGDAVLKGLGELLERRARAIDRVCRYGGEEFSVLLPETDCETAINAAERLRGEIEAQRFQVNADAPRRITVSIGIASFPAHADSARALVAAADAALYAAKKAGRNRISCYDPRAVQTAAQE